MTWKNDTGKAIYRDAQGNIVDEGDPSAAFLVAGPEGTVSAKDAQKYKLGDYAEKKQEAAPAEKSVKAPAENKSLKPKEDK